MIEEKTHSCGCEVFKKDGLFKLKWCGTGNSKNPCEGIVSYRFKISEGIE